MLQTPQHIIVSAMEEPLVAADQPDWDLKRVSVPVLVINAKSPFWTVDYEAYVRSISAQTDHRITDGVGHSLMLKNPLNFNAAFADMLRKLGSFEKGDLAKSRVRPGR